MAQLTLEIVEGPAAGRQIPLTGPVDIGREPTLSLPLDDTQVSRRHARIAETNGRAVVEDLGSTNGTFVNDQPIHSPRELQPGDRIRLGLTVIEMRSAQQIAARPSAVQAIPQQATAVGQDLGAVLQPVPESQLPGAQPTNAPAFAALETPAAYVPPEIAGNEEAISDYNTIASLVDTRVKRQDTVTIFAMLGAAAIAVLVYFGLS